MKTSHHAAGFSVLALLIAVPLLPAKQDSLVISVNSQASSSYKRRLLPDGNIKPQTYVVGDGGIAVPSTAGGGGDSVAFPTIVRLLAPRLARQSFYPARHSMDADLLLVLFWGETMPFNDAHLQNATTNFASATNSLNLAENDVKASMERRERQISLEGIQSPLRSVRDAARDDAETQLLQTMLFEQMRLKADEANARLLGYVAEINQRDNPSRYAGAGGYYSDLMDDIESPRYYVIVQAYDFQAAAIDGRRKLLWTTRISIPASGSEFSKCLPAMLADATEYFGRESGRLIRRYREGVVRLGELEIVGVEPDENLAEPKTEKAR